MLYSFFINNKKKITIIASLLIFLLVLFTLANNSLVIIETNSPSSVEVYDNSADKVSIKSNTSKKHTLILKPGNYIIRLASGQSRSKVSVQPTILGYIHKQVSFIDTKNPYKILTSPANTVVSGSNAIYAYDSKNRVLNMHDRGSKPSNKKPWPLKNVSGIDNINKKYAIVSFIDNYSYPAIINLDTGKFSTIKLEEDNYTVSSNHDGSFWVVFDNHISLYEKPFKRPVKNISADIDRSNYNITSSRDTVVASVVEYINKSSGQTGPKNTVIFNVGSKSVSSYEVNNLSSAKISKNSKNILYLNNNGFLSIYNTLKNTSSIVGQLSVGMYTWLDENSFLYSSDSGIWKYDIKTSTSFFYVATKYPAVSIDPYQTELVFSTFPDEDGASIFKTISNEDDVRVLNMLNAKLPFYGPDFMLDYSYINSPRIYVRTRAAGDPISPARTRLYIKNILRAKKNALKKIDGLGLDQEGIPVIFEKNQP